MLDTWRPTFTTRRGETVPSRRRKGARPSPMSRVGGRCPWHPGRVPPSCGRQTFDFRRRPTGTLAAQNASDSRPTSTCPRPAPGAPWPSARARLGPAVLLARGGFRTTRQPPTREQAQRLHDDRENRVYLRGVELPRELRIEHVGDGLARADCVF